MLKLLTWLKNVPFIGKALRFLGGNIRLAIEYVLIGLVIAGLATVITLWYRTKSLEDKNDRLHERVVSAEVINQHQDGTILELQELRKIDAAVMAGLITDYAKLSKADSVARNKLAELENTNANVRSFLDQPLPPELVCMLNDSCTYEGAGASRESKAPKQPH